MLIWRFGVNGLEDDSHEIDYAVIATKHFEAHDDPQNVGDDNYGCLSSTWASWRGMWRYRAIFHHPVAAEIALACFQRFGFTFTFFASLSFLEQSICQQMPLYSLFSPTLSLLVLYQIPLYLLNSSQKSQRPALSQSQCFDLKTLWRFHRF